MRGQRIGCLLLGMGGLWACGDEFTASTSGEGGASAVADGGAGQAGVSSLGGSGGQGGSAGAAGNSGSSGSSGHGGTGGMGGGAGVGGTDGGTSGNGGGSSGAAGATGGAAGSAGGAGSAGAAGSTPIACHNDTDCTAVMPSTTPSWCVVPKCDPGNKVCVFEAMDADHDGHATRQCVSNDPSKPVLVGDDCDDGDKEMFPGNWDGPAGDDHAQSRCDGKDQDCSGTPDDGVLADGTKCLCVPGEVGKCFQDATGKTSPCPDVVLGRCVCGDWTCQTGGTWGACVGAIPPAPEQCTSALLDEDCDGDPSTECECIQNEVADCSEKEDGTGIDWPGGKPQGFCQYGKKTCEAGGTWGVCIGAVEPELESCDGAGQDEDCDGQANEGCACTNGSKTECGCTGTQQCVDGFWGPCQNDTPRVDVCPDLDKDGYCVMSGCQSQCSAVPVPVGWKLSSGCLLGNDCADSSADINPGAKETCGDQIDMNCDGNISDGFDPEGQSCTVSSGCCLGTGVFQCDTAMNSTYCDAKQTADPVEQYKTNTCSTGNQSYDWNCDGAVERQKITRKLDPPEDQCSVKAPSGFACLDIEWLSKNLDPACQELKCSPMSIATLHPFQCACGKKADVCGKAYFQFKCAYDSVLQRCAYDGVSDLKYTMACK